MTPLPCGPDLHFRPAASRLGILGGSFNPPHAGHVLQARQAATLLGLSRLLVTPAASPPHKPSRGLLPFALRLALVRQAMADAGLAVVQGDVVEVDDREGRRPGPSYTIDTLREHLAERPGWEIFFLMGSLDLPTLPSWKEGLHLNELAHLAIYPREEDTPARIAAMLEAGSLGAYEPVPSPLPGVPCCWKKASPQGRLLWVLEGTQLPVCATQIRDLWRRGQAASEELRDLLPPAVLAMLQENREVVDAIWNEEG